MPMCHPPFRDGEVREKISAFFLLAVCLLKNCFSRIRAQGILRGSFESISTPRPEPRPNRTVTGVLQQHSGCRRRKSCLFPTYSQSWMQQRLPAWRQPCAFAPADTSRTQVLTRLFTPSTRFSPRRSEGRVRVLCGSTPVPGPSAKRLRVRRLAARRGLSAGLPVSSAKLHARQCPNRSGCYCSG